MVGSRVQSHTQMVAGAVEADRGLGVTSRADGALVRGSADGGVPGSARDARQALPPAGSLAVGEQSLDAARVGPMESPERCSRAGRRYD